jgi:hypothetical protein
LTVALACRVPRVPAGSFRLGSHVQFRWEALNALSHSDFPLPVRHADAANAATITPADDGRASCG